jgi:selenocysteine lyase/cysteine desulfurase
MLSPAAEAFPEVALVMTGIAVEEAAAVARWRAETPGCEGRVHLSNAGAALAPAGVLEVVREHLAREAEIGGYEAADEAAERVAGVYEAVAGLIGGAARNVAVVENATAGTALALSSFDLRPGDRIVTSRSDFPSNQIMYLSLGQRFGVETVIAAERPEGGVDPESVRQLVRDPRCRLVALTWVPTNSGPVQAAAEVGEVCASAGVPFLVDACQCVGQMAIDVRRLRCDFLSASARKFMRGPPATGAGIAAGRPAPSRPLAALARSPAWPGGACPGCRRPLRPLQLRLRGGARGPPAVHRPSR